jgi:mercuric reductase
MDYELMVIGGGTAGLRTATIASKNTKVLLIDPGTLGGTCLNTGCIPTKAMLYSSHLYSLRGSLSKFGLHTNYRIDFSRLMKRVNAIVKEGQDHIYKGLEKNKNLVVVKGKARFLGKNSVSVGKKTFTAKKIIISTGARNLIPPIKGIDKCEYLDNASVMQIKKQPKSIVMIGGGYISMEFATFFSELGTKVTVLEKFPTVLSMLDDDIRELLIKYLEESGIKIITGADITEVSKDTVFYNGKKIRAEKLFLAAGRAPNTEGLDLAKAGVELGKRGEILVNDFLETSNRNIYAIGDVNGRAMFAHAAKRESYVALSNALENKKRKMDFEFMPWAVFTNPPIGGVGINEKKAKELKIDHGVLKAGFTNVGRARITEDQRGLAKVIYNKKNEQLIGAEIIGPNADDIIHEMIALLNMGAKVSDLRRIIHIHPTFTEVMENLK